MSQDNSSIEMREANFALEFLKLMVPLQHVFTEIKLRYKECTRNGIKSESQKNLDNCVSEIDNKFAKLPEIIKITDKDKLNGELNSFQEKWFKMMEQFNPKLFFELKVDAVLRELQSCKENCNNTEFQSNVQAEYDRFAYFKDQINIDFSPNPVIKPFPTISPIFAFSIANNDNSNECNDHFSKAMSKSLDLALQFQKFKDMCLVLRSLSLVFERIHLEMDNIKNGRSLYISNIQFLSSIISYQEAHNK